MADQNAAAGVNHSEGLPIPETSSRCVTECGAHNFEVTNSELLVGMGIGRFVSSSTFSVGGYDWSIRFYPAGEKDDPAGGYASAFLFYLSETKNVTENFALTMLDKDGEVVANSEFQETNIFSPEANHRGWLQFIEKLKLKSPPSDDQLGNGGCRFTIRCVLTVIKEPPADQCKEKLFEIPPPELPGQLERVLKDRKGADVTILVGGWEFSAHRFMLAARSPVFDAQLFGPLAEKDTRCGNTTIEVVDMKPAIFEMFLHFIYTDSLPPLCLCDSEEGYGTAEMQHLLVAADRYGLDRLKGMCEGKLCRSINLKTVTSTLALANQHFCERLKNACEEFLSESGRVSDVLSSDEFRRLIASCTPLVLEDKEVSAGEKKL
ncbi:hypothetical protein BRADI_5g22491v3 [Brachypodium distachyon]|uniref:BTB domain-containing protein n=1 Tax=Brachypodium distachyon TaxID=15368 RepID=A0A0Q3EE75_BRADI|nr:hypothetical protein BRADI_5g22491v3 [Brachypodium distachyon]